MELAQLRCFLAVAEARSFTRATASAHLSQPALSRQIKRLEEELGAPLLKRYPRRVECTSDGLLLLPLAKNIVARADEASRLIRERVGTAASQVRFGATGAVISYLLPAILASFRQMNPGVRVDLRELDEIELEHRVASSELDFAIVTAWGSPPGVRMETLLTEEIYVVVPR
jgi:DNA-binding transcriptional LysR family regulator